MLSRTSSRDGVAIAPAPKVVASPLLAIVYSEFDNTLGPTIRCQAPEGFMSQERFDSISDYVITGRQLYGRLITVTASGYQLLGFPLCIENEKYARNCFLFNISFIIRLGADTTPYEPIVRKMALTLLAMEIESEFLFKPEKKAYLSVILLKILHDLNASNECLISLDEANLLSLKLTRGMREPPTVGDYEVPVFLRDPEILKSLDWDLALRQVIPHIDGVKYAKRLAMDAEMDVDCAKAALRTLVYYEFIALLDIFQFSNIYVTTELFTELVRNQALQRECQAFVCTNPASPLPFPEVLRLYSACRPDVTLTDIFMAQREKMDQTDPRRFVTFGVVYGFLRRVHRYPVYLKGPGLPTRSRSLSLHGGLGSIKQQQGGANLPTSSFSGATLMRQGSVGGGDSMSSISTAGGGQGGANLPMLLTARQVQDMMDGTHTMDELCVHFMKSFQELEELALSEGGNGGQILILYKR